MQSSIHNGSVNATSIAPSAASVTMPAARVRQAGRSRRRLTRLGEPISKPVYLAIAAASFILPFALWCFLSYTGRVNPLILPTPSNVIDAVHRLISDGTLWPDTKISLYRVGMGFALSAILAIPLGILMGAYKGIEAAHEPFVGFIRYIPVPALIGVVMTVAGIGEAAKIALIFIGTYFQMVIMVADITRQVPRELLSAARTLGANGRQLLFSVLLPATLPGLMDTCRIMIGWAWTYLIVAEVVATDSGLGYSIMKAQRFMRTDEMFVALMVLGLLGLASDMVLKAAQPKLLPWAEASKS